MSSHWRRIVVVAGSSAALGWTIGHYANSAAWWREQRFPGMPLSSPLLATTPPSNPAVVGTTPPTFSDKAASTVVTRAGEGMRYGLPSMDNVRSRSAYVLAYDRRNRVPAWVFEHLTQQDVQASNADRSKAKFEPDMSLHPLFRATDADYRGSGYDRGHMAAAGNHHLSQELMDETFLLSNIAPQVGVGFNRHKWNQLEKRVRRLCRRHRNVYVCTGPLYLPRRDADGRLRVVYEVIGANHVAVPTHFFKVVVGERQDGRLEMDAYVLPNRAIDDHVPLDNFLVPLESVERASGLLFFTNMERKLFALVNRKEVNP